jgi:uncharacterized protein (TIGR03086 family)
MDDVLRLFHRGLADFGRRVHAIRADQWTAPTPCTDWDVRALVNHLVVEQLWVPPLLAGQTIAEVGDRFDGDQLGDDPVGRWDTAAAAAGAAFAADGALDRAVHLSYGDRPAREYCREMVLDLAVHGWDLSRGIGADERMDPDLVATAYEHLAPIADQWQGAGIFAAPVPVPDDADLQTRLLGLTGRNPG